MPSKLFEVLRLLEQRRLWFDVRRLSPSDVTLLVTMVGRRVEISVDDDDMIDVSVFVGDEDVDIGMGAVLRALDGDTPWPMRRPPREDSVIDAMMARDTLVSSDTACAMFRSIVRERRGDSALAAQEPVTVEDQRNLWKVVGAGGLSLSVGKGDGAIVAFAL